MNQTFESKFSIGEKVNCTYRLEEKEKKELKSGTILSVKFIQDRQYPLYSILLSGQEDIRTFDENKVFSLEGDKNV